MQTRVLQFITICGGWYGTCGALIGTSCVLLYYAISCIRAYAYRIWSCTLLCVYYIYIYIYMHKYINVNVCIYRNIPI